MLDVCDSFKLNSNIYKLNQIILQVKEHIFLVHTEYITREKTIFRQKKVEVNDLPQISIICRRKRQKVRSIATPRTGHVIS